MYKTGAFATLIVFDTRIKNNNSCGLDNFSFKVIKQIYPYIIDILLYLINKSLEDAVFPNVLKLASVTSIFKKGDINKCTNYRHISVLSIFSKIIEKLVYSKVHDFLSRFDVVTKWQHGFCRGKSVESAISEVVQYVYDRLEIGDCVLALFFDFSRAFDFLIWRPLELGVTRCVGFDLI